MEHLPGDLGQLHRDHSLKVGHGSEERASASPAPPSRPSRFRSVRRWALEPVRTTAAPPQPLEVVRMTFLWKQSPPHLAQLGTWVAGSAAEPSEPRVRSPMTALIGAPWNRPGARRDTRRCTTCAGECARRTSRGARMSREGIGFGRRPSVHVSRNWLPRDCGARDAPGRLNRLRTSSRWRRFVALFLTSWHAAQRTLTVTGSSQSGQRVLGTGGAYAGNRRRGLKRERWGRRSSPPYSSLSSSV